MKRLYNFIGGLIYLTNWRRILRDQMPPEPVRDLTLLTAVDGSDTFTIGWTAAGDNPGQGTGWFAIDVPGHQNHWPQK